MSRPHDRHANWIHGEWRPASTKATFVPGGEGSAKWPRSSARDVEDALRAALEAGQSWVDSADRVSRVDAFIDALREVPADELALCLGLSESELAVELDDAIAEAVEGPAERKPGGPAAGIVLVYWDWRELFDGLVDLAQSLADGRTVIFVSDPALPCLGEVLARAAAGLPPGVFNVLHDDRRSALRSLVTSGELQEVQAAGSPELLDELEGYAEKITRSRRLGAPFGAGVLDDGSESERPEFELRTVANSSIVVGPDVDPVTEARHVFAHSVGHPWALRGLRSGQIGRVLCDERIFSAFSQELLALFGDGEDAGALDSAGSGPIDEGLAEHLLRARELGLDEGATLVWEGAPGAARARSEAGLSHSEGSSGSRGRLADVTVGRTVFTNVEEHMQLARLCRPAPLVCLMRVPSESAGSELAARLDESGG